MNSLILAQVGSEAAADVILQSLRLSESIIRSWDSTWASLLDDDGISLWFAIVSFSLNIAALALVYLAIQYGSEVANTKSFGKILEMFITPISVMFLLGNNGYMLARIILILRGAGRELISQVLNLQLAGIALNTSVNILNLNSMAMQRIRQVFQECQTLSGEALRTCVESKTPEAQAIVDQLSGKADLSAALAFLTTIIDFSEQGRPLATLSDIGSFLQGGFTQVVQDRGIPIVQSLLYAIQWAFVNVLEASLLLCALFAPIAVVLSLLPIAGNAMLVWGTGFISILGIQLGYNLLVGLVAVVMVLSDEQGAIEAVGGFGFLIFISIFSPWLAVALGRGGGMALYEGISRRAAGLITLVGDVGSAAARMMLSRR